MGKFQDMAKMLKLRKQAKSVQKTLKNIHIEADEGEITITISGEQQVVKVDIKNQTIDQSLKKQLEDSLLKAFNKAIKKSQEIAAENMKDIMAQLQGGGLANPDQK